ncbi:hypothetical protein BDN70DRAFT_292139 [Pholiota conissans]|uniref:Uncharacterized protein n=1 Tax=Pholiota conissans TaxID=109636 RepID=A0A9P6D510_9AGAR|nr:hypothetical protein BDN70DRAFT_292139 [Pholiota conissans]
MHCMEHLQQCMPLVTRLSAALDHMSKYNIMSKHIILPSTPIYDLLSYAPSEPLEIYALGCSLIFIHSQSARLVIYWLMTLQQSQIRWPNALGPYT